MRSAYTLVFLLLAASFALGQNNSRVHLMLTSDSLIKSIKLINQLKTVSLELPYSDSITFDFRASTPDIFFVLAETRHKEFFQSFWMDSGDVRISAVLANDLRIDTVIGSPFNDYAVRLYNSFKLIKDPAVLRDSTYAAIKENLGNTLSYNLLFGYLNDNQEDRQTLSDMNSLLSTLPESKKSHPLYGMITSKLSYFLTVKTIHLQKYTFLNKEKKPLKIKPDRGKLTLLDFWFSSCVPCVLDHEEMKKNTTLFKSKQVTVVGISTDEQYSSWKRYLAAKKLGWSNYLIDHSLATNISKDLGIEAFPTYILLTEQGNMIRSFNSMHELVPYLQKR